MVGEARRGVRGISRGTRCQYTKRSEGLRAPRHLFGRRLAGIFSPCFPAVHRAGVAAYGEGRDVHHFRTPRLAGDPSRELPRGVPARALGGCQCPGAGRPRDPRRTRGGAARRRRRSGGRGEPAGRRRDVGRAPGVGPGRQVRAPERRSALHRRPRAPSLCGAGRARGGDPQHRHQGPRRPRGARGATRGTRPSPRRYRPPRELLAEHAPSRPRRRVRRPGGHGAGGGGGAALLAVGVGGSLGAR